MISKGLLSFFGMALIGFITGGWVVLLRRRNLVGQPAPKYCVQWQRGLPRVYRES